MDSGISSHMTDKKHWFTTFETFEKPVVVRLGNPKPLTALGQELLIINIMVYDGKQ